MMKASGFIAGKLRFREHLATWAVGISFFIMIVAVAISAGFREEIRNGISERTGDVVLKAFPSEGDVPVLADSALTTTILSVPNVTGVSPAIYRTGVIRNEGTIQGVLFKGIPQDDSLSLQVTIPLKLARLTGLEEGDSFTAWFIGDNVKIRRFSVRNITSDPVGDDGTPVIICPLEDLRRVNGWSADEAGVLEVRLKDREKESAVASAVDLSVLTSLEAVPVATKYSRIFDWLDLIDFNVTAILILMTIVAGFNMISGLLIILLRNISTIGVLKSMGMKDSGIEGVFLRVSASLTLRGMLWGNAAALLFCLLEHLFHLIPLDPENYFVSWVPVCVNPLSVILTDIICFGVIMVLLSLGSLFISKVDPSTTVRSE